MSRPIATHRFGSRGAANTTIRPSFLDRPSSRTVPSLVGAIVAIASLGWAGHLQAVAADGLLPRSILVQPVGIQRLPLEPTPARRDEDQPRGAGQSNGNSPTLDDHLKPISEVVAALGERELEYPVDHAARVFRPASKTALPLVPMREWESRVHSWDATAFCHRPLYFADENLERHGRSFGALQPAASAVHFAGRFLAWPYLVGAYPTHDCEYNLGRELPGTSTTYWLHRPPASVRGALFEAGAISSLAFIVP